MKYRVRIYLDRRRRTVCQLEQLVVSSLRLPRGRITVYYFLGVPEAVAVNAGTSALEDSGARASAEAPSCSPEGELMTVKLLQIAMRLVYVAVIFKTARNGTTGFCFCLLKSKDRISPILKAGLRRLKAVFEQCCNMGPAE